MTTTSTTDPIFRPGTPVTCYVAESESYDDDGNVTAVMPECVRRGIVIDVTTWGGLLITVNVEFRDGTSGQWLPEDVTITPPALESPQSAECDTLPVPDPATAAYWIPAPTA